MRKRLHFWAIALCLHLVVSGVIWGGLCVLQRGYNTMHREQIALANVTVTDSYTRIQILQESCEVPSQLLREDSMLYYAAYAILDAPLQFWLYCADYIGL